MRIPGSTLRRPLLVLAAGLLVTGAIITPAHAVATDGTALATSLGDRSAGSYVDVAGKVVVKVTDAADRQVGHAPPARRPRS